MWSKFADYTSTSMERGDAGNDLQSALTRRQVWRDGQRSTYRTLAKKATQAVLPRPNMTLSDII
jgi:hypothetical protein